MNIDGTLVQSSGEAVGEALNIAGEAVSEAILSSLSAMTLKTTESLLGKDSVCNQCHFLVDLKKFDWAIKARTRTTPSTKKKRCVAERIKKDKLLHLLHFLAWSGFQRF